MGSKPLGHDDSSGFAFAKEMLCGDPTYGINFDRVQQHPDRGYIIFEYLKCEEKQIVDPWSSHPNKYWDKNPQKFISLWKIACELKAILYLVNYAEKGTKHEDKICVIKILDLDDSGIKKEKIRKMSRMEFSDWFRELNRECGDG